MNQVSYSNFTKVMSTEESWKNHEVKYSFAHFWCASLLVSGFNSVTMPGAGIGELQTLEIQALSSFLRHKFCSFLA